MKSRVIISVACLGLAGCGSPLDRLDRLEDVAPEATVALSALPAETEVAAERPGLFARLLGGSSLETGEPQREPSTEFAAAEAPQEAAPMLASAGEEVEAPKKSLFGFLRKRDDVAETAPQQVAADAPSAESDAPEAPVLITEIESQEGAAEEEKKHLGVLAWLRREKGEPAPEAKSEQPDSLPKVVEASVEQDAPVQVASLAPTAGWSLFKRKSKAVAAPVGIPFGSTVAFGTVAPVCDAPKSKLGKLVAQYPEKKPIYKLYDSQPGEKAHHAFYVTGFADGCLRQVSASVAVFGSVRLHEQLRYVLPGEVHPYSDTDRAYEKVKRQVCGVGAKKPCGEKLGLLEQTTVFLSLYDSFGHADSWANLLLHDGQLMASDLKGSDTETEGSGD